tara:strand:- start:932 stop:1324 length:393 start_codon:yes stop_codon:yes gene_type:complete
MIGYSPKFPLQLDNYVGAYSLTQTVEEVIRQNLMNLILTAPGERIMDINFGVGMRHYLFEQNVPDTQERIAAAVREQVAKYMPFVALNKVHFNKAQLLGGYEDQILDISIAYSVPSMDIFDSISVGAATT